MELLMVLIGLAAVGYWKRNEIRALFNRFATDTVASEVAASASETRAIPAQHFEIYDVTEEESSTVKTTTALK